MGALSSGAWGIVLRGRLIAAMLTRTAAERRLRREQLTHPEAKLVELWWSSGLTESV